MKTKTTVYRYRGFSLLSMLIALLLVTALSLSLFACGDGEETSQSGGDSSEPASASTSIEESSAEQSSEESEASQPIPENTNKQIAEIDQRFSGEIDRTKNKVDILSGMKYTVSREPDSFYPDAEQPKLTDGIIPEGFNKWTWLGYTGGGAFTVDFDLGSVRSDIADIEIHSLRLLEYAIGLPDYVTISVSDDGIDYLQVSALGTPQGLHESQDFVYRFAFDECLRARYLRIYFSAQEMGFLFISEIDAFCYADADASENPDVYGYYGDYKFGTDTAEYWAEEDDFRTRQNLALNKDIAVTQFSGIIATSATKTDNTPLNEMQMLVDGKFTANASWLDASLARFTRGDGRSVIIDLGKLSYIDGFTFEVLSQSDWGVNVPYVITASVSENGKNFQGIYRFEPKNTTVTSALKQSATLEKGYRARYFKLMFRTIPHAAISEIQVFGTKYIPDDALMVTPDTAGTPFIDRYAYPEDFGGVENILCTCIGSGAPGAYDYGYGMSTVDDIMPYVGYYNRDGALTDTFFDAFLLSPTSTFAPAEIRRKFEGWKHYQDAQFELGYNLDALNTAVGKVASELGLDELKAKIFFSIMRTYEHEDDSDAYNVFGDIDGDGKAEVFDNAETRKAAIKWMIDSQLERYRAGNYANTELEGFYWQEEYIVNDDSAETEILKYAIDYIHSLGYKVFWIPYYLAVGHEYWESYGFDMACMQPNYAFMATPDEDRLITAAQQSRTYGMAVEIEIGSRTSKSDIAKYREYLEYGVKLGYMDGVKIYYQNVVPGEFSLSRLSDDEYVKSIYHDTYLFAKGLLTEDYNQKVIGETPAAESRTIDAIGGRLARDRITIDTDSSYTLEIAQSPRYGQLRINADGSFVYRVPKGYTGTDVFKVVAAYMFGTSEPATVTINITANR